jgi:hypothetical protein
MDQPDAISEHSTGLSKTLAFAALTGATVVLLTLPSAAHADPAPTPAPPPGNTFLQGPPPPPGAPAPPAAGAPAPPPADPNAPPPLDANGPPPPPADPNAPPPPADPNAPPPVPSRPGEVDNAAGGFSYLVPAGWKVADATQLSYGQALLNKLPPPDAPPNTPPPNDTSVLLGRLDLKLFAGAETDNTKAAQRLASDMGEFFMPFPGTRINQQTAPLNAGGLTGVASYYEVKFTDTTKPNGQIWAGVIGAPTPPGTPMGQRTPQRWFVVWLGTANNPVPVPDAITLAQSIRPWTPPPPPPPDPNAPPPPAGGTNVPGQRPEVGVPMPVTNAPPDMQPPG